MIGERTVRFWYKDKKLRRRAYVQCSLDEFNDAAQLANPSISEPILITTNGTILAGFGRWRLAVFDDRHEINCIEYSLSEEEALQFIISHHQPQSGWNKYIRGLPAGCGGTGT